MQLLSIWLLGRKRLQPPSQTFATAIANICSLEFIPLSDGLDMVLWASKWP